MSQSYNHPRAVVHRNILDVAAAEPDASLEGIARRVTGATVPLVERVLENYGDPADEPELDEPELDEPELEPEAVDEGVDDDVTEEATDGELTTIADVLAPDVDDTAEDSTTTGASVIDPNHSESDADAQPADDDSEAAVIEVVDSPMVNATVDRAELSEGQSETLKVIADQPEASQRDIAAVLDISQSTVNSRLNSIEGFDWADRSTFATQLVEADGGVQTVSHASDTPSPDHDETEVLARLADLERKVDAVAAPRNAALDDPDLVRSVLRACFESESVSADQERDVVASLMGTTQQTD